MAKKTAKKAKKKAKKKRAVYEQTPAERVAMEARLKEAEDARAAREARPGWVKGLETLRSDFAKGPRESGGYSEFPMDQGCPVLVLGVEREAGRVFAYSATGLSDVQTGLRMAFGCCDVMSIRLVGTWPGQWRTDQFELNVAQYLEGAL